MMQFHSLGKIGYKVIRVRNLLTLNLIAGKRTHWSLILQSDCKWNYFAHTLELLSGDVPLGFLGCSCGELGSSSGHRDLKNDYIYGTLYIGISWQGS